MNVPAFLALQPGELPLTLREVLHTRNFARVVALEDELMPRIQPELIEPELPLTPLKPFGRQWASVWLKED